MSINKSASLLATQGFLSKRYIPANAGNELVVTTVTNPLEELEVKAQKADLAHPTEHNHKALAKLAACKENVMQSILEACLQPKPSINPKND